MSCPGQAEVTLDFSPCGARVRGTGESAGVCAFVKRAGPSGDSGNLGGNRSASVAGPKSHAIRPEPLEQVSQERGRICATGDR